MTSNPIWSVLPQFTVDESSTEMVQPYHGNHFLMDLIHQYPLTSASDTQPTTFPASVPYSLQNIDSKSVLSFSPEQKPIERVKISNSYSCVVVDSQPVETQDVCEESASQHEPFTIDSQNQTPEKHNLTNKKGSFFLINQNDKPTLDSTNPKVMQKDEIVSNEILTGETSTSDCSSLKLGKFFCRICDTNYCTTELFNFHLEQNEFSCRICTTEFTSHSDLKTHFLSHRGYRCVDCQEYFLCKEDLCNHRKSSLTCTSTFECSVCNSIFSTIQSLRIHKYDAHQNVKDMYNCIVCENKFTLPFKLSSHLKRYHVAYEHIDCTLCSKSVLGPEKLKIHKRKYHMRKKDPCTCLNCGKVFYCKDSLIRHEKSHHDTNEVVCEFCGKSCKGRKSLSEHIQYNHKNVERIDCKACNKEFKSMRSFKRHENSAHKPKIPVICEICGKTLKNKEQLKTHLQIHSSERNFKCDICSATFKQALSLKNHGRIHSSICKYNCSNCGKSFRWKQTFDKHRDKCTVIQSN